METIRLTDYIQEAVSKGKTSKYGNHKEFDEFISYRQLVSLLEEKGVTQMRIPNFLKKDIVPEDLVQFTKEHGFPAYFTVDDGGLGRITSSKCVVGVCYESGTKTRDGSNIFVYFTINFGNSPDHPVQSMVRKMFTFKDNQSVPSAVGIVEDSYSQWTNFSNQINRYVLYV